jgi:SAM-dependent methyltransferase
VVHHAAAAGFEVAADDYESARPGYPADALFWLVEQLGLDERSVYVDLAAGTGKLTRLLAPLVGRTVAVEPVAAMREKLHSALPQAEVLDGTAESLPLESGSVDAVTVAQAFHWFDAAAAAREIHRILRPSGRLAIVWNRRDLRNPAHAGMEEIVNHYREETPSHRSSRWRLEVEATGLFRVAAGTEIEFTHEVSRAGLVARVASTSFIAALPDPDKRVALADAQALADRLEEPIAMPHTCELYCLERLT